LTDERETEKERDEKEKMRKVSEKREGLFIHLLLYLYPEAVKSPIKNLLNKSFVS